MFSSRLPLPALIEHCRGMRHLLGAGLTLPRAMKQQSERGPKPVRPIAARMVERLGKGNDLQHALEEEEEHFPPLFVDLCAVGEDTGRLPEILGELEEYYTLQRNLKRDFIGKITLPMIQLVLAILVLSGLIFLREFLPIADFTGFNLKGIGGVIRFLGGIIAIVGILVGLYYLITRVGKQKAAVHAMLLRIPVIGYCLEAFALSRFCLGLFMTLEAGMPIRKALRLSLRGTGNAAFAEAAPRIEAKVVKGKSLTEALSKIGLFPEEFLTVVENAEESGQITNVMQKEARHYSDEAGRRLKLLGTSAARAVYVLIALFIIMMIFRLFGGVMQQRDDVLRGFTN